LIQFVFDYDNLAIEWQASLSVAVIVLVKPQGQHEKNDVCYLTVIFGQKRLQMQAPPTPSVGCLN